MLNPHGQVDQLLFAERDKLSRLLEPSALHGGNSRESPAGAALTLVLDRSHVTLIPPVNALWLISNCLNVDLGESLESLCLVSVVSSDELLAGQISKLVDTKGKGVEAKSMFCIVLLDQLQVADEHVLPVVVLRS